MRSTCVRPRENRPVQSLRVRSHRGIRHRQVQAAIQAFEHAIKILPDYAEAHEALGELYFYLNRPQEAARELQRAVAIFPDMGKAHSQLA